MYSLCIFTYIFCLPRPLQERSATRCSTTCRSRFQRKMYISAFALQTDYRKTDRCVSITGPATITILCEDTYQPLHVPREPRPAFPLVAGRMETD
ncbi:hypothetical protein FKM82_024566 [Ascaphus truei]